jgi:hypothetical protein
MADNRGGVMKVVGHSWAASSILLALSGVLLIGVGLYFVLLRPSLLPEDMRYMGLSAAQLDAVRPRLEAWLTQVFRVMGGYIVATGILTVTVAVTSFRARHWIAVAGALAAGIASIVWMTAVNIAIDSDFKWALVCLAVIWAFSFGLLWVEKGSAAPP